MNSMMNRIYSMDEVILKFVEKKESFIDKFNPFKSESLDNLINSVKQTLFYNVSISSNFQGNNGYDLNLFKNTD